MTNDAKRPGEVTVEAAKKLNNALKEISLIATTLAVEISRLSAETGFDLGKMTTVRKYAREWDGDMDVSKFTVEQLREHLTEAWTILGEMDQDVSAIYCGVEGYIHEKRQTEAVEDCRGEVDWMQVIVRAPADVGDSVIRLLEGVHNFTEIDWCELRRDDYATADFAPIPKPAHFPSEE